MSCAFARRSKSVKNPQIATCKPATIKPASPQNKPKTPPKRSTANKKMNRAIALYRNMLKQTYQQYNKVPKRLFKLLTRNELTLLADLFNIPQTKRPSAFGALGDTVYRSQKGRNFMKNRLQGTFKRSLANMNKAARSIQSQYRAHKKKKRVSSANKQAKKIDRVLENVPENYPVVEWNPSPPYTPMIEVPRNTKHFNKGHYTPPSVPRLHKANMRVRKLKYEPDSAVVSFKNKNGRIHPYPEPWYNGNANQKLNHNWQARKPQDKLTETFMKYGTHKHLYLKSALPTMKTTQFLYAKNKNYKKNFKKHTGVNKSYTRKDIVQLIYKYAMHVFPGEEIMMYFYYPFNPTHHLDFNNVSKNDIYTVTDGYVKYNQSRVTGVKIASYVKNQEVIHNMLLPAARKSKVTVYTGKKKSTFQVYDESINRFPLPFYLK